MRTFREYLKHRIVEDEMGAGMQLPKQDDMPKTDTDRWQFSAGEPQSQSEKEGFARLFELSRLAAQKFPSKLMSFLKTIQDDEIQQKVKDLENEGWSYIRGSGKGPEKPQSDDGTEQIVQNTSDMDMQPYE